MRPETLLDNLNLYEFAKSLIPDFVLSFAFFTSLAYAVLGKRFEKQRPAIAMSVSIGFALSIGLVWWERANELSIVNLGPIAVGLAILVLSFVMYQSIKQVGGTWAGMGITIGACIIIAQLLQINVPVDSQIIQTITAAALIVGLIAFLSHTRSGSFHFPQGSTRPPDVRRSMADLYRDRHISNNLSKNMRNLRKETNSLNEHPKDAGNVLLQLKRMLPAEGYLTERMAQLRAKAHQIRNGHIARLEETKQVFAETPVPAKKKASAEMAASYNQLVGIDSRLERLDRSVAENESRIKELTRQAQQYTARYDFRKLTDCLKAAENLQKHNSQLFKLIGQTENKLSAIARKIASEAKQINRK
ncbi:MAG: hypothetical protein A2Y10_10450 [Planctomycetes bacterium GWF2_41_51]|nr:MAG: hypothetical protein A2Y10_10450 [Planctomycetes bacterium GWF2_41_51]HBG27638.1 hypothetical protein [Phycisphaerales bacterium]